MLYIGTLACCPVSGNTLNLSLRHNPVIPAQAGIQWCASTFSAKWSLPFFSDRKRWRALDSRLRGNDGDA
ncbi:hypothetical protein AAKU67_004149 [Oxalobacteraceae bacterium GrIS 2.11]